MIGYLTDNSTASLRNMGHRSDESRASASLPVSRKTMRYPARISVTPDSLTNGRFPTGTAMSHITLHKPVSLNANRRTSRRTSPTYSPINWLINPPPNSWTPFVTLTSVLVTVSHSSQLQILTSAYSLYLEVFNMFRFKFRSASSWAHSFPGISAFVSTHPPRRIRG